MAEKLFYSMGEVAEMFDVNASLIRHWESQFSVIRPKRNKKGNRLFSPQDVENLKLIYHLVKERGMTPRRGEESTPAAACRGRNGTRCGADGASAAYPRAAGRGARGPEGRRGEILADADADTDAGAVPDAPDAEAAAPAAGANPW